MTTLTNEEIIALTLEDINAMSSVQLKSLESRIRRNLKRWGCTLYKNRVRKRYYPEQDYYLYRWNDCNVASGNILDAIQWAFVDDWDELEIEAIERGKKHKELEQACKLACDKIIQDLGFQNEFEVSPSIECEREEQPETSDEDLLELLIELD